MKPLQEPILDADFDIEVGYIEYDWFNWPCVYKNDELINRVQDCNAGMYAQLVSDDIDKLINTTQEQINTNLEKRIFRETKNDRLKQSLDNLTVAKNGINELIKYWDVDRINKYRKVYKFIDELFSVPLAKRLLSKFDIHNVFMSVGNHSNRTWYLYVTFHKGCVKVKDRQALVDEWTKICKKHGVDDIDISNADGRIMLDRFEENDVLSFDKEKIKELEQASEAYDFEIRLEFKADRL